MTRGRRRVLVINQRMDRTGAPSQLLTLLSGLGAALGAEVILLQGSRGPLAEPMRGLVDRVIEEPPWCRVIGRLERALPRPFNRWFERIWSGGMRRSVGHVDVVYVNSLISRRLARPFVARPLVLHVHELGGVAASFGADARELVLAAQRVLVPSGPARHWVHQVGVNESRVTVLPGSVSDAAFVPADDEAIRLLRQQLELGPRDRVVASVGWLGPLKGSDRFLEVARRVVDRFGESVSFVWVGGGSEREAGAFEEAVEALGLARNVSRLEDLGELRPLYSIADVTLLASREESLSLVALESVAQMTPVVCFPGAGGPDELAEEGVVLRATSDDPGAVAAMIIELLESPEMRAEATTTGLVALRQHHSLEMSRQILVEALSGSGSRHLK